MTTNFKNLSVRQPIIDVLEIIATVRGLRSHAKALEDMTEFYVSQHPELQRVKEALEEARAEALKKSNPAPASKGLVSLPGIATGSFRSRFYTHNPEHTGWGEA